MLPFEALHCSTGRSKGKEQLSAARTAIHLLPLTDGGAALGTTGGAWPCTLQQERLQAV